MLHFPRITPDSLAAFGSGDSGSVSFQILKIPYSVPYIGSYLFPCVLRMRPRKVSASKGFLDKIGGSSICGIRLEFFFCLWQLLTLELAREVSCRLSYQEV